MLTNPLHLWHIIDIFHTWSTELQISMRMTKNVRANWGQIKGLRENVPRVESAPGKLSSEHIFLRGLLPVNAPQPILPFLCYFSLCLLLHSVSIYLSACLSIHPPIFWLETFLQILGLWFDFSQIHWLIVLLKCIVLCSTFSREFGPQVIQHQHSMLMYF